MWNWTMSAQQCFNVLDSFYNAGGREVDSATNYPINKDFKNFRAAENILLEWLKVNGVHDLKVMMKIGSIDNLGTPDNNLSPSFLLISGREYQNKFKSNLATLMLHWDNRETSEEIQASLEVLKTFEEEGLGIGFSGLKYPDVYAKGLNSVPLKSIRIQIKHNLLYSDYARYAPLHAVASFIAYGINAGGLKLKPKAYDTNASILVRGGEKEEHSKLLKSLNQLLLENQKNKALESPERMNHLGLLFALYHPAIDQILVGTSKVEQMEDTFGWTQKLQERNYSDMYAKLIALKKEV